ncbi:MAG: cation diffusion facilitator family transporter [Thermodesulfobacteriota bacterium]
MATSENDKKLRRRLKGAASITALIFVVELVGGYMTNSLALLSDSAHVLMDVLALSISWFAHYVSTMPPTAKRTYGMHRFEVFASLINGLSLLIIALFIFYKAFGRVFTPQEVESVGMLAIAVIGLLVNIFVALYLRGFATGDLNVKSAYFHVLGDAAASVGVIVGAIIIYYTNWYLADPLISMLIAAIVFVGAINIVREATHILLEGTPSEIDLNEVAQDIKDLDCITGVHSLHIWSLCYNIYALSAHIEVSLDPKLCGGNKSIFDQVNELLAQKHHIFYTTLQAECTGCDSKELLRNVEHHNEPDGSVSSGHGHSH